MASHDLDTELDEHPIDVPTQKKSSKPKVTVNKWDPENLDENLPTHKKKKS